MRFTKLTLASLLGLSLIVACSDDDDNSSANNDNLKLNISGLEALGSDFVYEGWLIVNGTPMSTGRFTNPNLQSQNVSDDLLEDAEAFVLTLEPANETGDALAAPADSKMFRADFMGDTATISYVTIDSEYADLSATELTGYAFLRTPTDEPAGTMNNENDEAGIWFGSPGMPPTADLDLPDLSNSAGWTYEGWIVVNGTPYSTGTFNNPQAADDNASTSSVKGSENDGPPIPGEDFIQNLENTGFAGGADLRGGTAVISIEPVPDDSPAPFALKPLTAPIGQATAPERYLLTENFGSFPTGTITR